MAAPLTQPFDPALSRQADQQFGPRPLYGGTDNHLGRDYSTRLGMEVRAVNAGRIVSLGGSRKHVWGFYIHVDQGDGDIVEYHVLRDDPRKTWKVGDRVEYGQLLAHTGDTEKYDPHHHFGWQHDGKYQNPAAVPFTKFDAGATAGGTASPFPEGEEDMSQEDINWMKTNIQSIVNALGDPRIGITKQANAGADSATRALPMLQTIINWIEDPNIGIIRQLGGLAGNDVRVAELVKQIQTATAGEVPLVIPDAWLQQIAEAAREGGADAVKQLTFVTTVK